MQNIVANNIRKFRKLNKLSLVAFAKKIGVSPSNLSRIERGGLNINVQMLQKISDYFGVSTQFFFSDQSSVESLKNSHNNFVKQFREASKYINEFSMQTFVIAFSGDIINDNQLENIVQDINLLQSLNIRIVIVYGIRPQINHEVNEKYPTSLVRNIRVTDKQTLEKVIDINGRNKIIIESALSSKSLDLSSDNKENKVASGNFITARPLGVIDGVDMQFSGQIRRIDETSIKNKLDNKEIVIVSPLGFSPIGDIFNLSYEKTAAHVSSAINADKLIFYTNHDGILNLKGDLISELTTQKAENLIESIERDSSPETAPNISINEFNILKSSMYAIKNNVPKVHLVNRSTDGSIIEELFTQKGSGTIFTEYPLEIIRQAEIKDIKKIYQLISPLGNKGILLNRAKEQIEKDINHFYVIEHNHDIIGCAALYKYGLMAEIACFAIKREYQNKGYGNKLLKFCEKHTKKMGINEIFLFTTQSEHWFLEKEFISSKKDSMPIKRKKYYQTERNAKYFTKKL
jgi:amino-acid N-acetyltransferase